jgi:two-component system sensor histidine kinase KdpD
MTCAPLSLPSGGALETLRISGQQLPDAVREDLLAMAEEETVRLARYLGNVIDIVRLESGQVEPKREPVDLDDAIRIAVERASRRTSRHIDLDIGQRLPTPRIDAVLLEQVLANLLDNAAKFSEPGTRILIQAKRIGAEVTIAVEDHGIGVPPDQLSQIFDPFFRVRRGDTAPAGSGLGLAICRGLTHAMGGRILAESPVKDSHGTRMTAYLPA